MPHRDTLLTFWTPKKKKKKSNSNFNMENTY